MEKTTKTIIIVVSSLAVITFLVYIMMPKTISDTDNDSDDEKDFGRILSATEMMNKKKFTVADGQKAIKFIYDKKGKARAKLIESMLEAETNHFKSGQYQLCGSAGMEAGKWSNLPKNLNYVMMKDNHDGHNGKFIVWNSVNDFALYLSDYIDRHDGNYARWNSTNPVTQETYRHLIASVIPHYANTLV